jgi:hypothetical protein
LKSPALPSLVLAAVSFAAGAPASATAGHTGYYTYHYDNNRTGWNPKETALTVSTVASSNFGLVRTLAADSVVYAQPLYVPNVKVGSVTHNLVFIATENDSLYAYDADTGSLVWKRSFITPSTGVTAVPITSVDNCNQITPTIGISSTPVIDSTTNTIYIVDKTLLTSGGTKSFRNFLHAVNIANGEDRASASEVGGSVSIAGGGVDTFADQWQQNRAGLVLANGDIYVGFGSSCDDNPSVTHGWLFAYNKSTLKNTAIFNTTTTSASDYLGSIWQATYAPAADSSGNIYLGTGNGAFDAPAGGKDYGEAVLRLSPSLQVNDYFSPSNESDESDADQDIGSVGVMLVPGTSPQLAISGIKSGTMYLLDGANLGGFHSPDEVLQEVQLEKADGALYGGPAYYNGYVYWGAGGQPMEAFGLTTSPAKLTFQTETSNSFPGEGGEIPSVSSNGTNAASAVVWATTRPNQGSTIKLYAYQATNISKMLFAGSVGTWEAEGDAFLTPTIADGHVFVGGAGYGVAEFGLK